MNRLAVLAAAVWIAQGQDRSDLRWTASVAAPKLSSFQRLVTRIDIRVDGKEISDRHGRGEFVFMAEFRDSDGKTYNTQMKVDLEEYSKATSRNELECVLHAFVLPGDYAVTLSVFEPAREKRSVTHRTLHASGPNPDPMPELWRGLPAVEFIDIPDAPDRWFLPSDPHRLSMKTNQRIAVLANISPSEAFRRQRRAFDRNMDAIVPAVRLLSESAQEIEVVDVLRRHVEFEQRSPGALDWLTLRRALQDDTPNKIDVGALRDRSQDTQFFADHARKMASNGRVLIVLSAPVAFASRQDAASNERVPNARVYYLRFQTFPLRVGRGPAELPSIPTDDLTHALKPLGAKLINIYSPLDFRKALATILKEAER